MSIRAFAVRATGIMAGLMLVAASASSAGADTGSAAPAQAGVVFLATDMNGTNAPPADLDGTGRVVVRIQGTRVCFLIRWNNILAPFTGHIHAGAAGVNGPVVVGFWGGQLPATINGVTGCVTATDTAIAAILANPAGFYANVHNTDFPGGAIRGQLRQLRAGVDFNRLLRLPLIGLMDGDQEAPAAGDPDGRGVAFVGIRGTTTVRFAVTWSAIAAPMAGHIHVGAVGEGGPVVVPLFSAPAGLPAALNGIAGEVTADAAVVRAIQRNPSGHYANLHNAEFPGGAIRGQLARISG